MPRAKRVQNVNTYKFMDHGALSAIGTTALQLSASSVTAQSGIVVRADLANTEAVYIGNSDVTAGTTDTTDGMPLNAGDVFIFPANNISNVYARSTASSQKVYWFLI